MVDVDTNTLGCPSTSVTDALFITNAESKRDSDTDTAATVFEICHFKLENPGTWNIRNEIQVQQQTYLTQDINQNLQADFSKFEHHDGIKSTVILNASFQLTYFFVNV